MSRKFAVVHEAPADFGTATELADRALVAHVEWLDESLLDSQRQWVAETPSRRPLQWKAMRGLARDLGIRVHGHFDGRPGDPDAKAARRAVAILRHEFGTIDAVFLIRDADNQPQRRSGLEQAKAAAPSEIVIVIGLAEPAREAWVLSGFEPGDSQERKTLESETTTLGFDPRCNSHRLTARGDDRALRSPKRVLKTLTNNNLERQRQCWQGTDLSTLRERGQENGLASYLDEVERLVAPLFGGHQTHEPS